MGCSCKLEEERQERVVSQITELHDQISSLTSLRPSHDVNALFSQLVRTCIPRSTIDVTRLSPKLRATRSSLINLCAQAETLLESHFSDVLASHPHPLHHLPLFPYYPNYLKLAALESALLSSAAHPPRSLAFIGSGPLPLTSILLASRHLPGTAFHNYDIDPAANAMARRLVAPHPDLAPRMFFHDADVMEAGREVGEYAVVVVAALVGMEAEEKARVVAHLGRLMAPGAVLMVRSAHGARAFLYPVIDPTELRGFEVLSVYHPTDEVINSVIVARKHFSPPPSDPSSSPDHLLTCSCGKKVQVFTNKVMEELTMED